MKQNPFLRLFGSARRIEALTVMAVTLQLFANPMQVAEAEPLVVDMEADESLHTACTPAPNDCNLRGAVIKANHTSGVDTIILPPGNYRLTRSGGGEDGEFIGDLDITDDLILQGAGAATTFIDGNGTYRIFDIAPMGARLSHTPIEVHLSGITIRNGVAGGEYGGGIRIGFELFSGIDPLRIDAIVEVSDSRIEANHGFSGGGIFNGAYAELTLSRTLVYNNTAVFGAGIQNTVGQITIVNSTISTNRADKSGGGIKHTGNCPPVDPGEEVQVKRSVVSLSSSTIAFNVSDVDNDDNFNGEPGGGIRSDTCGVIDIQNTIIAKNTDEWQAHESPRPSDCYPKEAPPPPSILPFFSHAFNLDSDDSCNLREEGDQPGVDPQLGSLADDGTHPITIGSLALDKGGVCENADQRGFARPQDGDGDGVARCDIGAYEALPFPVDSFSLEAHPDGSLGDNWGGATGLRFYRVVSAPIGLASDASQLLTHVSDDGVLDVGLGGPIFWKQELGPDQQASIKFLGVSPVGIQGLLLKVKPDWKRSAIVVYYNPVTKRVGIATYKFGKGLQILHSTRMRLHNGDQLSGRAQTDGSVQAYVNGLLVIEANAGTDFQDRGGVVGLLFIRARHALLDDFSGATIPQ